jgi:hypothetical protein
MSAELWNTTASPKYSGLLLSLALADRPGETGRVESEARFRSLDGHATDSAGVVGTAGLGQPPLVEALVVFAVVATLIEGEDFLTSAFFVTASAKERTSICACSRSATPTRAARRAGLHFDVRQQSEHH